MTYPKALGTLIPKPRSIPDLYETVINVDPVPIPEAPRDLIEFRALPREKRYKPIKTGGTVETNFFDQQHVQDHLEAKWKAELHNRDIFLGLWEAYKAEPDGPRKHALEVKLAVFKRAIMSSHPPFWALCLYWKKYVFTSAAAPVNLSKPPQTAAQGQINWDA